MLINVSTVLLIALTVTALEGATRLRWIPRWAERGFTTDKLSSWVHTGFRAGTALVATVTVLLLAGAPAAAFAAGTMAWLCVLAIVTDLTDVKIPREPAWAVLLISFAAAVSTFSWTVIVFAAVAFALFAGLLTLTALLSRGGLGSGDVRLMLAMTPLAGWLGISTLLWALLAACVIQFPLRFFIYKQHYPDRTGYPFAPALVLGLVAGAIFTIATGTAGAEMAGFLP